MIRILGLAVLLIAIGSSTCPAQMGGGGMGGDPLRRAKPVQKWTVKVEGANNQAVTGRLAVDAVPILCDLGYYQIKPEKVKTIEFEAAGDGSPSGFNNQQNTRKGAIVTTAGERIVGMISIPQGWTVETEIGSLQPDLASLRSIAFVESVEPSKPGDVPKPADSLKPADSPKPGQP